ncbi:carbon starvation CstA family protein [Flammeovirga agarivorans]|uniref:Carbon starvation protein A n=1 Tax=Flammeovirga agarivorans TaxID=2726742 RepID=A0A7X8SKQ7_9BACT|nr:carbon starvation protein A [Flammeovirga agarivorans]NLR91898.1 carbon starvation protein A [Flammeovirga agarivorans]
MITFLLCIATLIGGYFFYAGYLERQFGVDESAPTPAITKEDGIDYVPMKLWKTFLIQFLNIAGLGPIFGAIAGALWGPVAFLWIVFGCIFAGTVHDYISGMLSIKMGGGSISEIVSKFLGKQVRIFMTGFSVLLLILVGVVFVKGPATIIHQLTDIDTQILVVAIFIYYLLATMIPIDKLIGKLYPFFGVCLLIMAVGILSVLLVGDYQIPELTASTFRNMHSDEASNPIFPLLFVTIACGAISGFHSTQSPMMARCVTNEKQGRIIFAGAMITEGIVALVWAAAAIAFFGGVEALGKTMAEEGHNAAWVVNEICNTMLGKIGGILAIFGVVAAPITSGDTAFRSARLTVADAFNVKQKSLLQRLLVTAPLFAIAIFLTTIDFSIIWRYFGWSNQVLATIVLWACAVYMQKEKGNAWYVYLPATFMTAVVVTYIMLAPIGFHLSSTVSNWVGITVALALLGLFLLKVKKSSSTSDIQKTEAVDAI